MEERVPKFIEERVEADIEAAGPGYTVCTRFPPEPNGYLHIGHAKAISIDFGMAEKYNGKCNLRLDDTNPTKEDTEYVDAIMEDIKWLGFKWDKVLYASDYFDDIYAAAVKLIKKGKAYVDDVTPEQMKETALKSEKVQELIAGREMVKCIAVPKKLINIVVKG